VNDTKLRSIRAAQQLTQEYASYSQSRNGLGNVLGGVAGLAIYVANGLLGPGLLTAAITIGLTLLWLIGKELIRRRLYRPFGEAREIWAPTARRWHIAIVTILASLILGMLIWGIISGRFADARMWPAFLIYALIPAIAWRYLRTINEFLIGVPLLIACAYTSIGGAFGFWDQLQIPLYAAVMIAVGIAEHRQFRVIAARLRAQREEL
jgi:hypothetical protein